jgi:hypothetical protein
LRRDAGLRTAAARWQPSRNRDGFCWLCAADRRPPEAKDIAMITRTKLVIGTLAAGLTLAACGAVAGTPGQGNHGKPFAQHQVQRGGSSVDEVTDLADMKRAREAGLNGQQVQWGDSGSAEFKDLAAVKRDLQRTAVEDARARPGLHGVLVGTRPALSPDSGLAGCSSVLGAHEVAARDYPKIAAQFASSRWPDLRVSGLAYVEIATKLRSMRAYGGETVWFIERLAADCAQHRAGW